MSLSSISNEAEQAMDKAVSFLKSEFRGVRTGRASPALVDQMRVSVAAYGGAPMELKGLATVTVPEPTVVLIKPFDPGTLKDIERAIQESDIGINPMSDGKVIRLPVPPLSGERREQIANQVKKMAEGQKIALRNVRRDAIQKIDAEKKAGDLPEDDAKKGTEQMDKLIKKYEGEIEEMTKAKQKEVMDV